jgi:hypothetical protein
MRLAHGTGVSVRSALPNTNTPSIGAFVGYAMELEQLGFGAQLHVCDSQLSNAVLQRRIDDPAMRVLTLRSPVSVGSTRAW